ncbi:MAG: hypothetical protein EBT55_02545 [Proteobacteria bacterium]|nr:hypothetical protein [Pseudomonadota bacterium]
MLAKFKSNAVFFIFFFVVFNAFANNRPTTFDDRFACEKSQGVWREFGNGCVDNCIKKIDPYNIVCTSALTYGCECGKNRCWNAEKCVALQDYQVQYQKQQEQENLESNKDRLARQQEAQKFRRDYVAKLIKSEKIATSEVKSEEKKEEDPNSFTGSNKQLIYDSFENKKTAKKKDLEKKLAEINEEKNTIPPTIITNNPETKVNPEKNTTINNNPPPAIETKKPDSTSGFLDSLGNKFNNFLSSPANNNNNEIPPVYVVPQNGADLQNGDKIIDNLNKQNTPDLPIVPLD